LKLVEIQTKVASVIPFSLGSIFVYYRYGQFYFKNFIFMFISLLVFDMTATAINNYIDYKKAIKTSGYNYELHNVIVRDNINETVVVITIILLFSIASGFGLMLFLNTNYLVLILGAISFLAGIFYSFGPIPISRMPLGEIFSGIFMGFVIVFLAIYIHIFNLGIFNIEFYNNIIKLIINSKELLIIFIISIPTITGIANIMLANNICDIDDDLANNRYTLPTYISRSSSLKLFSYLYYFSYFSILIAVIFKILPFLSLLSLLSIFKVQDNINKFEKKQDKKETFILSVKNFIIINYLTALTIFIMIIL
jgi:1,4-dihydroxy-2-naphthoate octaprenyltransferase